MKSHRRFARFWDWAVRHEPPDVRRMRRTATDGIEGRVLEVGVGVGANWPYLPPGIVYAGVDPDTYMMGRARAHAAHAGIELHLCLAAGEALPFADYTFDVVLSTLTLCSVDDQATVLAEIRRVLKPGGTFRFWEHVRPGGRVRGRLADFATPGWKRIGGGCHPNRRTVEAIQSAGFTITGLEQRRRGGFVPFVYGVATASDAATR